MMLIVNKVVDSLLNKGGCGLLYSLILRRLTSYDHVNWSFLLSILAKQGLGKIDKLDKMVYLFT